MLYGILFLVFFTVYKNNATSNLRNGTIYNIYVVLFLEALTCAEQVSDIAHQLLSFLERTEVKQANLQVTFFFLNMIFQVMSHV